jgi:general L-amino acid transport system permease protein
MAGTDIKKAEEAIKPPVTSVGVLGWIRANLFNNWFNSVLTLVTLYALGKVVPPFFRWAFVDSLWLSTGEACKGADGACWSIIPANIRFILFGFFPYESQWRPLLAMVLLIGLLFYSRNRDNWKKSLLYAWGVGLLTMGLLMKGGMLGLDAVETTQWGGLPLTLLLSVFGLAAAYPLGVVLALGRQSQMPAVKVLCVVYIEMIRGYH